jgi:phage tail protein X
MSRAIYVKDFELACQAQVQSAGTAGLADWLSVLQTTLSLEVPYLAAYLSLMKSLHTVI